MNRGSRLRIFHIGKTCTTTEVRQDPNREICQYNRQFNREVAARTRYLPTFYDSVQYCSILEYQCLGFKEGVLGGLELAPAQSC